MKKIQLFFVISPALFNIAGAATVASWKEFNTNAAVVPIFGANTDSPIFGDGVTSNSAQAAWIAGQFGTTGSPASVTLAVGDTLTMSGGLILTGGSNNSGQFRFGVFNDGGQFAADGGSNWTGGYLHGIGTSAGDLFRARTDGPFISTGGNAMDLNAVISRTGTFDGDSTTPFSFSMSITRDSETTLDVVSLITGGDGSYSEQYVEDDIIASNFTFTAAGVLFGGSSEVEEASFLGVQYEVSSVPEPSSFLFLGLSILGCGLRRRR